MVQSNEAESRIEKEHTIIFEDETELPHEKAPRTETITDQEIITNKLILEDESDILLEKEPRTDKATEKDILKFAGQILVCTGGIFVLSLLGNLFWPSEGSKYIFDKCTTILPAIATLVIGFYYAKS